MDWIGCGVDGDFYRLRCAANRTIPLSHLFTFGQKSAPHSKLNNPEQKAPQDLSPRRVSSESVASRINILNASRYLEGANGFRYALEPPLLGELLLSSFELL